MGTPDIDHILAVAASVRHPDKAAMLNPYSVASFVDDAADIITTLRAENQRLREEMEHLERFREWSSDRDYLQFLRDEEAEEEMSKLCPICKLTIRNSACHWFGDDVYHLACLWGEYQRLLKLSNRLADEVNMLLNEAELVDPEREVSDE